MCAADGGMPVRRNGNADPRSAHEDAKARRACRNRFGKLVAIIRIIDRHRIAGSKIMNIVPLRTHEIDQRRFHIEPGVVGRNGDRLGVGSAAQRMRPNESCGQGAPVTI